jgi:hypothetical protein
MILPSSGDDVHIDTPAPGQTRISGSSGGVPFESLAYSNTPDFTLDARRHDFSSAKNVFGIDPDPLNGLGTKTFTLRTGYGSATLSVSAPVNMSFIADSLTNQIIATGDFDYALSNQGLQIGAAGNIGLRNVRSAILTGGQSDNHFSVAGWRGIATLDGQGGADTYSVSWQGVDSGMVNVNDSSPQDADQVIVNGTSYADKFTMSGSVIALGTRVVNFNAPAGTVFLNGLGGADSFNVNAAPHDTNSHLILRVDGGAGSDTVSITGKLPLDFGGLLDIQALGGDDNDTLTLNIDGDSQALSMATLLIDGGAGIDTAHAGPFVQVKNCEK